MSTIEKGTSFESPDGHAIIDAMVKNIEGIDFLRVYGQFALLPDPLQKNLFDALGDAIGIKPLGGLEHVEVGDIVYAYGELFTGTLTAAGLDTNQLLSVLRNLKSARSNTRGLT